jgi:putative Holliday junction resolvase
MKILGVDYGTKHIGIAISDEMAQFAFPKDIIPNDDKLYERLASIIQSEGVTAIVLGDPGDNQITPAVKAFAQKLEVQFGLEVIMEKEFMTSLHVSQASGKKPIARQEKQDRREKRDDSAAALILQRYLDKHIS